MRRLIIILISTVAIVSTHAQASSASKNEKVKWLSIEEAEKQMKQSPKPLFIDTYTDWCGWCKKMDQDTFSNPVISDILNNKFYPVKFNAESKEEITFLGQTFVNDGKAGNAHQLAVALLRGELSFPTVVFLTSEEEKVYLTPLKGYRDAKEMELLLGYFSEEMYKTKSLEEYQKEFTSKIK
ncbi:MAG: DUF255 domain-containing protein [Bacteroidetes bacterium]|jgi:thioredoxin-related protein|nr:DUF255 domain-containing protein [Bacteroidota bacterium]